MHKLLLAGLLLGACTSTKSEAPPPNAPSTTVAPVPAPIGSVAVAGTLTDEQGATYALRDGWADKQAVVVFYKGFF